MADYPGNRVDFLDDQLQTGLGRLQDQNYPAPAPQWQQETGEEILEIFQDTLRGGAWARNTAQAVGVSQDFPAELLPTGPEVDWFDHVFVSPLSINAGVVLGTVVFDLDVYSSYKSANRSLDTFVNNLGAGSSVLNLPTLPFTILPQSGFTVTLQLLPDGVPVFSADLDFGFDTLTISVTVSGQRSILLTEQPVGPIQETLIFATDVRKGRVGTEQRASLRHTPRSRWNLTYRLDGEARRLLSNVVFDSQARVFGLPMWNEPAVLQSPIAVSDLTITVDSTQYSHLVADGLAIAFTEFDDFEVLQIDSLTNTTITFKSAFTKTFGVGDLVFPIRLAQLIDGPPSGRRWPRNLEETRLTLTSVDNEQDLSDTSAFSTFDSKVLLDDPNLVEGTLSEGSRREVLVVDSQTGKFEVFGEWPASRRTSAKGFYARTRQSAWELRQLLHALRGQQVSFYLPTFAEDLKPVSGVGSGSSVITVENDGYSRFVAEKQPRDVIRLTLTNGTTVERTVLSSSEIDEDDEQLTVDSVWGVDATVDEIERIDFVEKVRGASDEVTLTHLDGLGQTIARLPVIAVLD